MKIRNNVFKKSFSVFISVKNKILNDPLLANNNTNKLSRDVDAMNLNDSSSTAAAAQSNVFHHPFKSAYPPPPPPPPPPPSEPPVPPRTKIFASHSVDVTRLDSQNPPPVPPKINKPQTQASSVDSQTAPKITATAGTATSNDPQTAAAAGNTNLTSTSANGTTVKKVEEEDENGQDLPKIQLDKSKLENIKRHKKPKNQRMNEVEARKLLGKKSGVKVLLSLKFVSNWSFLFTFQLR